MATPLRCPRTAVPCFRHLVASIDEHGELSTFLHEGRCENYRTAGLVPGGHGSRWTLRVAFDSLQNGTGQAYSAWQFRRAIWNSNHFPSGARIAWGLWAHKGTAVSR